MPLELPKTAAKAASQAGQKHTASNDHLELSVRLPHNGVCSPGSTLSVRARARQEHEGDALSLRLIGESSAKLMGKARWQTGTLISMTATPGGGLPVSGFERFTFLNQDIPLPAPASPHSSTSGSHNLKEKDSSACEPYVDADGFIQLVLPFPPDDQLLPSLPKHTNAALDQTDISVSWTLQLSLHRKGFFRVNKKLSLELPISFPVSPWRQTYPTQVSVIKRLKFEGAEAEDLAVDAKLSCQPTTTLSAPLRFALHLTPSLPQVASLLSTASFSSPAPTCFLTRQVRTAPIEAVHSGREYTWPAVRFGKEGEVRKVGGAGVGGGLEWVGEVTPPPEEYTVDSRGVSVKYALIVQLSSSIFADGTLRVSLPVFLPSSAIEVDDPLSPPEGGQAEPVSQLPVYEP